MHKSTQWNVNVLFPDDTNNVLSQMPMSNETQDYTTKLYNSHWGTRVSLNLIRMRNACNAISAPEWIDVKQNEFIMVCIRDVH